MADIEKKAQMISVSKEPLADSQVDVTERLAEGAEVAMQTLEQKIARLRQEFDYAVDELSYAKERLRRVMRALEAEGVQP